MAGFGDWLRGLLGKEEPGPGLPRRRSDGPQSFADDNNEFALAVYAKLRQQPGNLFFSPFSIRTALAMTQAGARAETAAQMREALCISSSEETQHVGFAEIISRLNASGRSEYDMAVANSLWAQAGAPLQPEFVDLIARQYGGTLNVVDFRRSAEAGRVTINQWVEHKTRQKIREPIPSDALNADTRLVVVNAVYFKGRWMLPFREEATRDEPFHLESGAKVRSRLMHQLEEVRYRQARGYQAVDLFYRGGDLSMLILLPERKGGLRDLEKRVLAGALHDCVAEMVTEKVSLFLPRFKLTGETVNLRNQLTTLGMPLAFSRVEANFSGINGHEPPTRNRCSSRTSFTRRLSQWTRRARRRRQPRP